MPWSNQGGGPWGSGGGGSKGPWGSGPQSSGPNPPDLEELLRRSQDKLKSVLPGGSLGSRGFAIIALGASLKLSDFVMTSFGLGINLVMGFAGNDLYRWTLARRSFGEIGLADVEAAESV